MAKNLNYLLLKNYPMKTKHVFAAVCTVMLFLWGCTDNVPFLGEYPQKGIASWYSGGITASGERFNPRSFTCAMRRTDYGKFYKVCNIDNSKCVVVKHNNFGPAKWLFVRGRIVDLSKAAFSQIADSKEGLINVTIEAIKGE